MNPYFSLPDRESVLSEAESLLSEIGRDETEKHRKAETYVKVMKKVLADGDAFVWRETNRVEKVLAGNLKTDKKKEMQNRLNVLKSFIGEMKREEEIREPETEQDL